MLRLVLLSAASLAVIGLVMATADPDKKRALEPVAGPVAIASAPEAAKAEKDVTDLPEAPSASELAPDAGSAASTTTQTVKRTMPGPALHPSPQYETSPPPDAAPLPVNASTMAKQYRITGNRINMRAGPGTNEAVIASLSQGQLVIGLEAEVNGWIHIRTENGATGYIASRFISGPLN